MYSTRYIYAKYRTDENKNGRLIAVKSGVCARDLNRGRCAAGSSGVIGGSALPRLSLTRSCRARGRGVGIDTVIVRVSRTAS